MTRPREQALVLLAKARQDEVLLEEVLASPRVADEIVGFHAQQAIEKLLKAALSLREIRYRKTHDLRELLDLLRDIGCALPERIDRVDDLTPYGTLLRYEAMSLDQPVDRQEMLDLVRQVRRWVESQLG
ncbi:MAG: HEPN domain-containing protein [Planctomycetaceae bacterium]|nr:HEPN domain-containing protein [Planctomycetaceae bacterium]